MKTKIKIFKCDECKRSCKLAVVTNSFPKYCVLIKRDVLWNEVKEEACKVSMQDNEESMQYNKLPDWVKVKEWGYNKSTKQYFIIIDFLPNSIRVNYFPHAFDTFISNKDIIDNCTEARKRPFNDAEMKALVGEKIEHEDNAHIVVSYAVLCGYAPYLKVGEHWQTAKSLMDNDFVIDGKPCYVLEHLENGEWVE